MATTISGDYVVTGALFSGNWAQGAVYITPTAGSPTQADVTGLNLRGTGTVRAKATAVTVVPGQEVMEVSVADETVNGFSIFLYRTNDYLTPVYWMAFLA